MKKMTAMVLALATTATLVSSIPAEARIGSSSSHATSSYAYKPAAANTSISNSRVGGGNSVGMSRPDVMAQARAQTGTGGSRYYGTVGPNTAPRVPDNSGYSRAPAYIPAPNYAPSRPGYSGAQVAGAALAGAVVGGLATHALDNNRPDVYVQGAPAPVYAAPSYNNQGYATGGQYAAPTAVQPQTTVVSVPGSNSGSGAGTFLFILFLLAVAGALAYFFLFRNNMTQSNTTNYSPVTGGADPEAGRDLAIANELRRDAARFYRDIQSANNRGDKQALTNMTDNAVLLQQFIDDIDGRTEPADTRVLSVCVVNREVLGFLRDGELYKGSIHFSASIAEGERAPEQVNEVYHFVRNVVGGQWRVAGIEQV